MLVHGSTWPQVRTDSTGSQASAGPTGNPWVDSNGYRIQIARAVNPEKPVWLDYGLSQDEASPTEDSVRLAIAEACAYGGRWILRPELAPMPVLEKATLFFERFKDWRTYRPVARLAVAADFTGPSRNMAAETLNLLIRRRLPYAVIPVQALDKTRWQDFAAVLYIGKETPAALRSYKGMLIRPATADPYQIAVDTHMQMSRQSDVLRLWNAGSLNAYYTEAPGGGTRVVHLLNYAARNASGDVTLGLQQGFGSARIITLDDAEWRPLEIRKVRAGIEMRLAPFPVYAAIELKA